MVIFARGSGGLPGRGNTVLTWGELSGTGSGTSTPNAFGLNVQGNEQVVHCLAAQANTGLLD